MVSRSLEFLGQKYSVESDDLDRGPQKRACGRSLVAHIDICLDKLTDRFFDIQSVREDCYTMAGDLLLVYGGAGRQSKVLQIMERATQLNTRIFGKINKTLVNTYSEMG